MKTTLVRIAVLTIVILAILLSVRPQQDTAAVTQFTVGVPSETAHNEPMAWADAKESLYIPAHTAGYRLGDCYADRTDGDLYPQPDPFCLPVPSVENVSVKQDTEVHIVTVDVPAIEPSIVEPPVITPEEPSTPEQDTPEQAGGNPGNTKNVGNAGENPNGRGTMPNDNAGGNGNGEHGNQGEGGHNK